MRGEKWMFWFVYLSAVALLPYTLMNMLDPAWLQDRGWMVLIAWITLSLFQWCLFLMNISYRKIVR